MGRFSTLALTFLTLTVCTAARAQTYTLHLDGHDLAGAAGGQVQIGDWLVTVAVDESLCEIYCTYHRTRSTPLSALLIPPVLTVRIESNAGPLIWIVDPAGTRLPRAGSQIAGSIDPHCLAGKDSCVTDAPAGDIVQPATAPSRRSAHSVAVAALAVLLPLRV